FYKDLASHNSKKSKNFKAWCNLPLHWNLLFQVSVVCSSLSCLILIFLKNFMGYTIIHQTVKKSKKSEPAFRLTLIHSKQYYNLF
ncbi:hypothetical protein, partial [Roseburia faecis]|uniref:hypothetical protein n=1 Tax=Roseburia faecis TaxID=301302 RepID=UPI001A9C21DB